MKPGGAQAATNELNWDTMEIISFYGIIAQIWNDPTV